jgi:AcrR family transcriptional regulator
VEALVTLSNDEAVERVHAALERRELATSELTARRLGELLGQTTAVIYHRWGSLEGFLYAVAVVGFGRVADRLEALESDRASLADMAEYLVTFAVDHPELYELMQERRWDWAALRKAGHLRPAETMRGAKALHAAFVRHGLSGPTERLRLFAAGMHGIAAMAITGRLNAGENQTPDRVVAIRTARHLARLIAPGA